MIAHKNLHVSSILFISSKNASIDHATEKARVNLFSPTVNADANMRPRSSVVCKRAGKTTTDPTLGLPAAQSKVQTLGCEASVLPKMAPFSMRILRLLLRRVFSACKMKGPRTLLIMSIISRTAVFRSSDVEKAFVIKCSLWR